MKRSLLAKITEKLDNFFVVPKTPGMRLIYALKDQVERLHALQDYEDEYLPSIYITPELKEKRETIQVKREEVINEIRKLLIKIKNHHYV